MSASTVDVKQLIQAQTVKVKNIFENIKTQKAVKPSQAKTSNICCFNLLKCDDLLSFSAINIKSLGFGLLVGLIKLFEDVTLDFGKL